MENTINRTANGNIWEIAPTNIIAAIILGVLFFYLFFRHFLMVLMLMDIIFGWLREFEWFPKSGKRLKTFLHWLVALGLFIGFLTLSGLAGWLEFIPR